MVRKPNPKFGWNGQAVTPIYAINARVRYAPPTTRELSDACQGVSKLIHDHGFVLGVRVNRDRRTGVAELIVRTSRPADHADLGIDAIYDGVPVKVIVGQPMTLAVA